MNKDDLKLLKSITGKDSLDGAYNIRKNGTSIERKITENTNIVTKEDNSGIDIYVKDNASFEFIYIPVIITESGLMDVVYNDFHIGENSNVYILAGCGIKHNDKNKSEHDGIHRFYIGENSKVTYIENHYGEGDHLNSKILNPTTEITLGKNSKMDMDTTQIKGVDKSIRKTYATLNDNSTLTITEKIMTEKNQSAKTLFETSLNGNNSNCHIVSRSFATEKSKQEFRSKIMGNNKCYAHVECDAIIKDNGIVSAIPEITAKHVDANLIHEATIGKIAGEQLTKLMSLGLSKKEAEKEIIEGFLQ
ncbi:MAG TPA: SufD family Fe-S cluster assembly protein [Bacilli bacterium]|nr:SufD family Fe-S cluster assembly protein [Bacilli bacterium]